MTGAAWLPTDPASTNVGRFMAAHGIGAFDDLLRRSIDEPEWFWDAVVRSLGIEFASPTPSCPALPARGRCPGDRGGEGRHRRPGRERHV